MAGGNYQGVAGKAATVERRIPFTQSQDLSDLLIRSSPQDSTEDCGGMAIAYALVRIAALTDASNIKDLLVAMGSPSSMTSKGYWASFSKGSMFPRELIDMGSDLYTSALNQIGKGPGLSATEMFRYLSSLHSFGALISMSAVFDLQIYGWSTPGSSTDSYHWVLSHNGVFASSAPDGDGKASLGSSQPPLPTGSYLAATVSSAQYGFVNYVKNDGRYPGPGGQGVQFSNNPHGVSHDSSGFQTSDAAAQSALTSPAS